jgi:hypothetical protein
MNPEELKERFYAAVGPMRYEFDARAICIDELRNDEFFETIVRHYTFSKDFVGSQEHIMGRIALAMQFGLTVETIDEQLWAASDDLYDFCHEMA